MREDPIFYKDWEISIIDKKLIKNLNTADLVSSLLVSITGIFTGFIFEVEYVVLLWSFYMFISIIIELIMVDSSKDQINNKLIMALFLLTIFYITFNQRNQYAKIQYIEILDFATSFLLAVFVISKLVLILIYDLTWRQLGEILKPKNENSKIKLENQYKLVQNTQFRLPTPQEIKENASKSISYIVKILATSILITLFYFSLKTIALNMLYSDDPFRHFIGIGVILVYTLALLVLWTVPLLLIIELTRQAIRRRNLKKKIQPLQPTILNRPMYYSPPKIQYQKPEVKK